MRAKFKKLLLTLTAIVFMHNWANAQLTAGFTVDKTGGCSPFTAFFTNTTNASGGALYKWDFGNGNTSSLKNPGAIFKDEGSYTITLTVIDSNKTSSISHSIEVYSKPSVDFDLSIQKGCVPLSVTFNAKAAVGNGSITDYFWDFGDGMTQPGSDSNAVHIYTNAAKEAVSLTVTDNHGCQSTILKKDIIEVLPELVSSFSVEKPVICKITDPANFINNSTGPRTLSYNWDFGDSTTSTVTQPSHVFAAAGLYNVSLTVISSTGCTVTKTMGTPLNVATFKSNITIPDQVCQGNAAQFDNKSLPAPDKCSWEFSDGFTFYTAGNDSVVRSFPTTNPYSVKVTNTFGSCKDVVTKAIPIRKSPQLSGFITDITSPCGSPVLVNFRDTTATAVKWEWTSSAYSSLYSTEQAASSTFLYDDTYYVTLKVTDAAGCISSVSKSLNIFKPKVIVNSKEDYYGNGTVSCGPITVHLSTTSSEPIKTYSWDLGDGDSSTEATPTHLYDKAGNYYVHLTYTTLNGCTGEADLYYPIAIRDRVKADFTTSNTNVCGNTTVTFNNQTTIEDYYSYEWDFGDGTTGLTYSSVSPFQVDHNYQDSGHYTIRLIATNGICADTMVKEDFVKVFPPFPNINGYTNTCEGTRGEVTIANGSKEVENGTWNFGDGTTALYTNDAQLKHTYTKTGSYKLVLITTSGKCTMGDTTFVKVLLKQHPVLSADKTIVCSTGDPVTLTYSNLEPNPESYGSVGYGYGGWYHSDGSYAIGQDSGGDLTQMPFKMSVWNFTPGEGLYSLVTSANFQCTDTTNLIPLTIKGPITGFKQDNLNLCETNNTVTLEDTSTSRFGVSLVSWQWNFGDGQSLTVTHGGKINHTYNYTDEFVASLDVTDAQGCHAFLFGHVNATGNSLKASFTPSATTLSPGSSVTFTNTSQTQDTDVITYKWLFGDGTQTTTTNPVKVFSSPGKYQVTLIAYNTTRGCTDTASVNITVKYVNAAFQFSSSSINNSKCAPFVVSFTNTSSNVSRILWDFGDGSGATGVFNPTHVYTQAGRYIVQVTTFSDNGTSYVTKDSVIIDQPSANIKTDILHSCTAQSINFTASGKHADAYLWDFGDGTIFQASDTFASHHYLSAGVYIPNSIVTDTNGCSVSVNEKDTIIIDSLDVSLPNIPSKICAPKEIVFNPDIVSISGDHSPQSLIYHWNFGTGNISDTSSEKNTSFQYQEPGNYSVNLRVESQYGCIEQVTKNIIASQGLGAYITGPTDICENTSAAFEGNTKIAGQPKWEWIFDDRTIVDKKDTPPKEYPTPGNFSISLVVDNNGCIDTVSRTLQVHAKPQITLSVNDTSICEGTSISIIAAGGSVYEWRPSSELNTTKGPAIIASPETNTSYVVLVTNSYGCVNFDSVKVTVIRPFTLELSPEITVCSGKSIMLHANGALTYEWIGNTEALNNASISDPVATPSNTTTYTVVGSGENHCFSDTADVKVIVKPSPVINLGNDTSLCQGQTVMLNAFNANAVYTWQDNSSAPTYTVKNGGEYFVIVEIKDCTASDTIIIRQKEIPFFTLGNDSSLCSGQQLLLTPSLNTDASLLWQDRSTASSFVIRKEGVYSLTATNECGSYTDSIAITTGLCNILMPDGFTPNGDGLNDIFRVKYPFAVSGFRMQVYNSWGEKVFESSNINIGWDGTWKGEPSVAGIYVWVIRFTDASNKLQQLKGTVTLIR